MKKQRSRMVVTRLEADTVPQNCISVLWLLRQIPTKAADLQQQKVIIYSSVAQKGEPDSRSSDPIVDHTSSFLGTPERIPFLAYSSFQMPPVLHE